MGGVLADADQPSLAESLATIEENQGLYGTGGAARLLSGLTWAIGAWLLLRTWIIRERFGTPLVPALLAASGVFTVVSGASALVLAAGAGLLIAALFQWRAGDPLRRISPASAVIGAAMQFIWVAAATIAHPIIGTLFFVWLAVVGLMLLTGRVERQFIKRFGAPATS